MISFEKLCGSCKHQGCCTDSSIPLVFPSDLKLLKSIGKDNDEFLTEKTVMNQKIKAIKKKPNSNICIFWNEEKKACSIYKNRPFDCRAYPFDIKLIDGKYHWIVYSCNPESNWKWSEDYLKMLETDMELNGIAKHIETFANNTELTLPQESEKTPFAVLREVKIKIPNLQ